MQTNAASIELNRHMRKKPPEVEFNWRKSACVSGQLSRHRAVSWLSRYCYYYYALFWVSSMPAFIHLHTFLV